MYMQHINLEEFLLCLDKETEVVVVDSVIENYVHYAGTAQDFFYTEEVNNHFEVQTTSYEAKLVIIEVIERNKQNTEKIIFKIKNEKNQIIKEEAFSLKELGIEKEDYNSEIGLNKLIEIRQIEWLLKNIKTDWEWEKR